MPTYFIRSEEIHDRCLKTTGSLDHHLRRVLRCRVGERIHLVDERQHGYLGEISAVGSDGLRIRLVEELTRPPFAAMTLTLGQSLLKGDRMDWTIQKGTELGIGRLDPIEARRCTVHLRTARGSSHRQRWQRIATEAAQQSARWTLPEIGPVLSLPEWLKTLPVDALRLLPWEAAGWGSGRKVFEQQSRPQQVVVLVGPEGGFDPEEVEAASEAGFHPISLGPRTLRSETAAVSMLTLIQHYWGDLG